MFVEAPALRGYWYVVAESDDIAGAPARRAAARRRCRDLARTRRRARRRPRPLPASRGAAVAGPRRRRLPRVLLPRLDVRRRGSLCARAVGPGRRAGAAEELTCRRCTSSNATASSGSASASRLRGSPRWRPRHDPTYRRINSGVDTWRTSAIPDDRQLHGHLALPVRPRRDVRHPGQPARPEDLDGAARRRLLRLSLRGRGRQRGRRRRRPGSPPR